MKSTQRSKTLLDIKPHVSYINALSQPACLIDSADATLLVSNAYFEEYKDLRSLVTIREQTRELLRIEGLIEALSSTSFFNKVIAASFNAYDFDLCVHALRVNENIALVTFAEKGNKKKLVTTASAMILTCSYNGNVIGLNGVAERVLSETINKPVLGKPVLEIFESKYRMSVKKLVNITLKGDGSYHTEAAFDSNDAHTMRLLVQAASFGEKENGFIIILHIVDVQLERALARQENRADLAEELNEILKLEIEKHRDTQKKLTQSERFASSIVQSSVDMIVSLNEFYFINEFNQSAEKTIGIQKREAVGKHIVELLQLEEDEAENIFKNVDKNGLWEGRLNCCLGNGKKLLLQAAIARLQIGNDDHRGYVCSMRDITESNEAEIFARAQQAKIEAIFNSGSLMFWTVNRNTALTSFNNEYREGIFRLYGEYPQINKDLNKPKKRFATDSYHDFWQIKYESVFKSGKREYFQTNTRELSGKENYREIFLSPIVDATTGEIYEVAGMAIDISDKKATERKMNEQSAKIQAIFNASNHMIWSVDRSFKYTSFNEVFVKRMLERFNKKPALMDDAIAFVDSCNEGKGNAWKGYYEEVLKGEKVQLEELFTDLNGKEHLEDISLHPIRNERNEVTEIAALSQTVTFKRSAERKLKEQAAKINAIFDSTAMLIWTVDINLRIVAYNRIFANQHFKLLGREVSIGTRFTNNLDDSISAESMEDLHRFFELAFKGERQQFEGVVKGQNGQIYWMETFLNPIYLETGEIKEISCLSYDITDKKQIQKQMLESIEEKEILLQEVHHRVKNNLQVISSILNLQSSYVKDQNSLNILRESQNRIKSMSFIHESLYHTRDFSKIEFSDYILSLSNNLIHSYSIGTGRIDLVSKFEKVYLILDQAIPCGLIVNELVSNALKYAFPDNRAGQIIMTMTEVDNTVQLSIGDNGVGLPADLDVENSESLGLQLVYTLADQIDANISVTSGKGTEYLITFDKQ